MGFWVWVLALGLSGGQVHAEALGVCVHVYVCMQTRRRWRDGRKSLVSYVSDDVLDVESADGEFK